MRKAVEFGERALEMYAGPDAAYSLAITEYIFANMLLNLKKADEALTHAQRAVALIEPLHLADPANQKWRRGYQLSLSSAGIAHRALSSSDPRQLPLAVQILERAHALASKASGEDPKNARAKDDLIAQSHRLARALIQSGKPNAAAELFEQAGEAAKEMVTVNPQNRRYWYLSAVNQVHYGDLRLHQGLAAEAQEVLLSANAAFERALTLDPFDAVLLEARASQFHMLAMAAEKLGNREVARQRIGQCLDVLGGMIDRDSSAKDYVGDYRAMITLSRRLGVSTRNLPDP
jgi:tetratricopeptide (TPR) repeat protein